jgi:hypothetical protein
VSVTSQENAEPLSVAAAPLHVRPGAARPESESATVPLIVAVSAAAVEPSAGEEMVNAGGVLSRFTVTLTDVVLPLVSVAVPVITWLAPSVATVCVALQVCIGAVPLPAVQTKDTVALQLFQPAAFGAGDTEAVMCGRPSELAIKNAAGLESPVFGANTEM